jgi:hypothetical protein
MKKFLMATAALSMISAANAATLNDVSGSVLVNKGEGFVAATGAIELNVGDKVMVGEGGFATVSYDNCAVALDKPTLHAVAKVAPCDAPVISPVADIDPPVAAGLPILPLLLLGTATAVAGYIIVEEILDEDDCASCNGELVDAL